MIRMLTEHRPGEEEQRQQAQATRALAFHPAALRRLARKTFEVCAVTRR
jgi:hypothetical protein